MLTSPLSAPTPAVATTPMGNTMAEHIDKSTTPDSAHHDKPNAKPDETDSVESVENSSVAKEPGPNNTAANPGGP